MLSVNSALSYSHGRFVERTLFQIYKLSMDWTRRFHAHRIRDLELRRGQFAKLTHGNPQTTHSNPQSALSDRESTPNRHRGEPRIPRDWR